MTYNVLFVKTKINNLSTQLKNYIKSLDAETFLQEKKARQKQIGKEKRQWKLNKLEHPEYSAGKWKIEKLGRNQKKAIEIEKLQKNTKQKQMEQEKKARKKQIEKETKIEIDEEQREKEKKEQGK